MKPIIRVSGLGKAYRIGQVGAPYATIRETLSKALMSPANRFQRAPGGRTQEPAALDSVFWALKSLDCEIYPGEVVGVIGRNGAGKSTLLKVLSRITEPTTGRVELYGRVGSLLEVGTGFHPELSGRENIYLNGAILGMTRREIARNLDQIVSFAEIDRFVDTPVKRYSSGMYMRLAFAVAAHLEPEILVVDEVLAVGDAQFQKKCMGKMNDVAKTGRTVVFVSHSAAAVQSLCTRGLLLQDGRLIADGQPERVLAEYIKSASSMEYGHQDLEFHRGRTPGSTAAMHKVWVRNDRAALERVIRMGDDVVVNVAFTAREPLHDVTFGLEIKNHLGISIFGNNTLVVPPSRTDCPIQTGLISARIPRIPLMPGIYHIDLYLGSNGHNFDVIQEACRFEVAPVDIFGSGRLPPSTTGNIFWPISWEIASMQSSEPKEC